MTIAARLPDDILFNIFQHFKPDELVKIEKVCRSWHQSARAHKSLWRDGSLYSTKGEFCPIKYYNRFKSLAQRNGGKFTKLFLNICLLSLTNDDIRKLIMVLLLIKVSELWIVVGFKRHCPPGHPHCYLSSWITIQIRRIESIQAVMIETIKALIKCTTLTKLRLTSSVDVGKIDLSDCGDPANWPINKCKLEEIHLTRLRYDILFPKEANHQILSQARSIRLPYGGKPNKNDEKRIWRLIETAKDTLEYCWIERLNDVPHHIAEPIQSTRSNRLVTFPALKSFSVDFDNGLAERIGDELDILEYSMDCPLLEEADLSVMTPNSMVQDLVKGQIKFLSVGVRDENHAVLNESFRKCQQLEKLMLWHQPYSKHIYENMAESTMQMPLKELRVLLINPELFEDLVKFIKNRSKIPKANKIETISFLHQQHPLSRDTCRQLYNLVGNIKVYSRPPNEEFIKILEKHNGCLSFEQSEDDALL